MFESTISLAEEWLYWTELRNDESPQRGCAIFVAHSLVDSVNFVHFSWSRCVVASW